MEINRYFVANNKVMNIEVEKTLLIERLQNINDLSMIQAIKHMIDNGLEKENRISIMQYNRELDEAESEMNRGEYISHEELKKQMEKW